jgi:hypothetical protein
MDLKKINQVANFAPTDWNTNILISDRAPSEYWPELVRDRKMKGQVLAKQLQWHALPDGWESMSYEDFLIARRKLIAVVIRDGYMRLADPTYQPEIVLAQPPADEDFVEGTILDLLDAGLVQVDDLVTPINSDGSIIGEIIVDGEILLNDMIYDSPGRAALAVDEDVEQDGWDYWGVVTNDGPVSLRDLSKRLDLGVKLAPSETG